MQKTKRRRAPAAPDVYVRGRGSLDCDYVTAVLERVGRTVHFNAPAVVARAKKKEERMRVSAKLIIFVAAFEDIAASGGIDEFISMLGRYRIGCGGAGRKEMIVLLSTEPADFSGETMPTVREALRRLREVAPQNNMSVFEHATCLCDALPARFRP